jgi:hypothetical protein
MILNMTLKIDYENAYKLIFYLRKEILKGKLLLNEVLNFKASIATGFKILHQD